MTEAELHQALAQAIAETLEKMFFVPWLEEPVAGSMPQEEFAARLEFEGSPPGRLTLRIAAPTARSIAADFLGEAELAPSERRVEEVICELANMICGAVLSRVENAEDFRLGAPRLIPPAGLVRPPGGVAYSVETGGGLLEVVLEMENLVCPAPEESAS
jgi:CheY-specific phosphatase CheX